MLWKGNISVSLVVPLFVFVKFLIVLLVLLAKLVFGHVRKVFAWAKKNRSCS